MTISIKTEPGTKVRYVGSYVPHKGKEFIVIGRSNIKGELSCSFPDKPIDKKLGVNDFTFNPGVLELI